MRHYGKVFAALGLLLAAGLLCAGWGAFAVCASLEEVGIARREAVLAVERARQAEAAAEAEERRMPPVRAFLEAWKPHQRLQCDERELGLAIRAGLESLAQQKLSLVTDQATTPEPCRLLVGGRTLRVQRVSLRASGESLGALAAWLGEAEALFPYARIDGWELSSGGGANSALRVLLSHPLGQDAQERKGGLVQ